MGTVFFMCIYIYMNIYIWHIYTTVIYIYTFMYIIIVRLCFLFIILCMNTILYI